ncbi:class I SAM-dependent methyltransferase [Pseudomonas sp. Gutcm_11s]|uniref:class I SAM-dependent methyltransferase n=1 Tax=Pseudomonas sp. Gutcm_11s TaxID=3026088 RepID=UPI002361AAD1|nr:class I SAM-dependent methyltransferase [Pseudomonas sp. Gutcm_11s]MDD0843569.1 class I SAM-dependent methyltransferase [Pseudomonas sp. Gutcm_11s]
MSRLNRSLLHLGQALHARAYRFTSVTPLTQQRVNARAQNAWATDLAGVFGWSRPFHPDTVGEELFGLMDSAGVLHSTANGGWLSTVRWSSLDDELYVHSCYPTSQADAVFFGPDTYRFAQAIEQHLRRQPPEQLRRVLDIGCGAGPGALLVARACPSAEVLAVDINPLALEYTDVNARLAGIGNLRTLRSDLLASIGGEFDLILSNPPYMLDPQGRLYRDGGGELGVGLSLAIIDEALAQLAPGGCLLLYTGVAMVGGRDPLLEYCKATLPGQSVVWSYREMDPDVFGEQLLEPGYEAVERIAAVALTITRSRREEGGWQR